MTPGLAGEASSTTDQHDPAIVKSEQDKRSYRVIELQNGLVAVLIHDPEMGGEGEGEGEAGEGDIAGDGRGGDDQGSAGSEWETASEEEEEERAEEPTGQGVNADVEMKDAGTSSSRSTKKGRRKARSVSIRKRKGSTSREIQEGSKEGADASVAGREQGREQQSSAGLEEAKEPQGNKQSDVDADGDDEGARGDEDGGGEESEEEDDSEEGEDEEEEEEGQEGSKKPTKKAAAAMCVGVGSFMDPPGSYGLAHLLEHMLFMGSEKFPDENEYDAFLTKHGGGSNAFTDTEYTCFHFDVNHKHLKPALDRFAQFFISPLVKADSLEREVQAVESEFQQTRQSDDSRLHQTYCHTCTADHPFHKFSWGNRLSLVQAAKEAGVDLRQELLALYNKCYLAGAMRLAVLGAEPLDTLEEWAREMFSAIRPGGKGIYPVPLPKSYPTDPTSTAQGDPAAPANGALAVQCAVPTVPVPWNPGTMLEVESVKEQQVLSLTWPLPCLHQAYRTKPHDYVSHLVGHEGAGSLLALLKSRAWATGLTAGVGDGGYDKCSFAYMFNVSITLTTSGLEHQVHDIIALLYQYLNMLRREGAQEWVFRELADISRVDFQFAEEEAAEDYTVRLASNLFLFPKKDVIFGDYVHSEWDTALVARVLDCLVPGAMRVDLQLRKFDHDAAVVKKEPWFEVSYVEKPLPPAQLQQWEDQSLLHPALHLPPRNQFIPTDFFLCTQDTQRDTLPNQSSASPPCGKGEAAAGAGLGPGAVGIMGRVAAAAMDVDGGMRQDTPSGTASSGPRLPECILSTEHVRAFFKADDVFRTPRANVYFSISSPAVNRTAREAGMAELFVKLVEDSLIETSYLASVAKLDSYLSLSGYSLELKFYGFSQKLPLLVAAVFDKLAAFKASQHRFKVFQEELCRGYRNANMRPLKHSQYLRLLALRTPAWTVEEKLQVLTECTVEELQQYIDTALFAQWRMEVLVHGNVTRADALALVGKASSCLPTTDPVPASSPLVESVVELPPASCATVREPVKNPDEENSVVEMYFQCFLDKGRATVREKALLDLWEQLVDEPIFNTLRTQEQLGYRVSGSVRLTHGVHGFCVLVQSAEYDPGHIVDRMDAFLKSFLKTLKKMPLQEFLENRAALQAQKREKDHTLLEESNRHWAQIVEKRYVFDSNELEATALNSTSQAELATWVEEHLLSEPRRLVVQVWGSSKWASAPAPPSAAMPGPSASAPSSTSCEEQGLAHEPGNVSAEEAGTPVGQLRSKGGRKKRTKAAMGNGKDNGCETIALRMDGIRVYKQSLPSYPSLDLFVFQSI